MLYPTDFLFTEGHPQPLADLLAPHPVKVIAKIKNIIADI
jgi:hypothetical protein